VVVSLEFDRRQALADLARKHDVPLYGAGRVSAAGGPLVLQLDGRTLEWDLPTIRRTYFEAIPRRMQAVATSGGEGA
jgi:hypothetical protein